VLSSWERAEATSALAAILIWLLALGAALSVVAGDARALVGSIGLFGLALSWALQTPIESFTGWLLNSFRSYYRIGDRIGVGEVFGDVSRIDFLTTTVFEAGGPEKNVRAAQSTGALITFPNAEILRSNVTNYTRDFPYVYDELTVGVTHESDLRLAIDVVERTAMEVVGERMAAAAETYASMLERAHLAWDVATEPEVYVQARESWIDLIVRFVVPVREMRKWSTRLQLALHDALAEPEVARHVRTAYPRTQVEQVRPPAERPDTPGESQ
jgi:small-conductance mechanosensitive channel